jgi:FKBP-type peptidyl-prolyl cis-trans isomerase FkpA
MRAAPSFGAPPASSIDAARLDFGLVNRYCAEFSYYTQLMKRAILLITLLAAAGCGSSSTSASTVPPTSVATTLVLTDLVIGTGTTVASGNTITVAYTGWLYDTGKPDGKGTSFDSSTSAQFRIGVGAVIAGWDQGVPGMRIGGTRRLLIPPALAYGANSPSASIPPNASMVFEITVKSIP